MHFIVEEIDEDTSMEELQKMMLVALVYRILVCFYEVSTRTNAFCIFTVQMHCIFKWQLLHLSLRSYAFGEQEEPPQESFSLDSELWHVTHQFWFSQTGFSWCRQLTSLFLRKYFFFIFNDLSVRSLSAHADSLTSCNSTLSVSPCRSTVRALNKNFSIAFFFPAFITLLFFQHNRTVYDMVAGTIVVKRSRARWCCTEERPYKQGSSQRLIAWRCTWLRIHRFAMGTVLLLLQLASGRLIPSPPDVWASDTAGLWIFLARSLL